jgi:hypothetical protein
MGTHRTTDAARLRRISVAETGISVAVDVDRLAGQVAEQVARRLAELFPADATEFWVTLAEQAAGERRRVAALAGLVRNCPNSSSSASLNGLLPAGGTDESTDDSYAAPAPLDPHPRHQPAGPLGRRIRGQRTPG